MKKITNIILWITYFIIINIVLYFLCILTITPYFKIGSGLKMIEEKNNEIIFNNYKLNMKKLITKEDYILNLKTNKEISK